MIPLELFLYHYKQDNPYEAAWLLYLCCCIGRHPKHGWALVEDIYGALGDPEIWTWKKASREMGSFRKWLIKKQPALDQKKVICLAGDRADYADWNQNSRNNAQLPMQFWHAWNKPEVKFGSLYDILDRVLNCTKIA